MMSQHDISRYEIYEAACINILNPLPYNKSQRAINTLGHVSLLPDIYLLVRLLSDLSAPI